MKKEDFVTTFVMTAVSILMLVGVTIAWYTRVYASPTVVGMNMEAEQTGDIKIALETEGKDIADLKADDIEGNEYVVIGLEELTNIETGKMAPGAFGQVTFYVTPLKENVTACRILPSVQMLLEAAKETGESDDAGEEVLAETDIEVLVNEHIAFFTDEAKTQKITEINQAQYTLEWDAAEDEGIEKEIVIYWQWYYEYPFLAEGEDALSAAERENKIRQYDLEDTRIGNEVDKISFHFAFESQ